MSIELKLLYNDFRIKFLILEMKVTKSKKLKIDNFVATLTISIYD